jgi:anti-sigma factor RsiW
MINPQPTHDSSTREELVAYLDGELDAAARQSVEERLARDAEYRSHLQSLQQAWDLLDELPRSSASESFTRTTV